MRHVYMEHPHCKAVFGRKFSRPVKIGPRKSGFLEIREFKCYILFSNPEKVHSCVEPRRLTYLRENRFGASAVGRWKNPEKRSRVNIFDAQFRAYREKKPL